MASGTLSINLRHIADNWAALDAQSSEDVETAAVVKADGYGLDSARVAKTLSDAGARIFFVAVAEEGAKLRNALGPDARICVFSGHMAGDTDMIRDFDLIPMLNSVQQLTRHLETVPGRQFGMQLDSGMNRLGVEPQDWDQLRATVLPLNPVLLMSHLACADDPDHPMNASQLACFKDMTDNTGIARSLAATGGIILGPEYHFDLTRPGIGLYGGAPFVNAEPTVHLSLPIIQTRQISAGEHVGYGASFTADKPMSIATLSAGYADGLIRAMSNMGRVWAQDIPCPIVGRVSMDMIGVDVTHLSEVPSYLDIICPQQTIDDLAEHAGTIGYEILTQLGQRYRRQYVNL